MKILIDTVSEILDDKLTLIQKGILITILLLKEDDPKLTLAKSRAKINFGSVEADLIKLHEQLFIEWSGYEKAIERKEQKKLSPQVKDIINFMNNVWGSQFNPEAKTNQPIIKNIKSRLRETSVDDCKLVISNRWLEWKNDPLMKKYLTALTVFRPSKFPIYLEMAKRTGKGEAIVSATKNNLKPGDEITYKQSLTLIDREVYTVKTITFENGRQMGSGVVEKKYGKEIKRQMRILTGQDKIKIIYEGR